MYVDLILVGFGNVARRFVRLLEERGERLGAEHDLSTRIIAIATRRHGCARDLQGLDARRALELVEAGQSIASLDGSARIAAGDAALPTITTDFIRQTMDEAGRLDPSRPIVMVETTVLDIARGQPAISHVQAALESGAHVITANKGPVAFAAGALIRLARDHRRAFHFEGAVMDGIPIFNLVRDTLPVVSVIGFRGVLNSTTNHIITAMEKGEGFGAALAEMQAAGIAEADASFDVDGWDAAAKTAALINVLMGGDVTPHDIRRTGIGGLTSAAVCGAVARNRRVKLVASAGRGNGRVSGRVAPEELPATDLLATLEGQQNALVLQTDLLGEIAIVQRGSGLTQTAYALLSDLVAVRRRL
ncbi:MAG: homoserine dehydrogenase [Acidobacteria bacterium]|nr:homoserine dehydrogenase [Acidobacteriota bacterium]